MKGMCLLIINVFWVRFLSLQILIEGLTTTVLDDGFVHFIVAIVAMRYVLLNINNKNY